MTIRGKLLLGLLFCGALASQAQEIHFAFTNNDDGTATVTEAYYTTYFKHAGGPFTVPSSYKGMPVTSIGAGFSDPWGAYFTSITIPATITNIDDYAFEDDDSLTSVYFEGNAPNVGLYSFETHSQGNTTAYYLADTSGWVEYYTNSDGDLSGGIFAAFGVNGVHRDTWTPETGSVEVTITPAAAVAAGVQWTVDGGQFYDSGAISSGIVVGPHIVSFNSVPGWTAPSEAAVTVKNGLTAKTSGKFTAWPPNTAPLTVQVSGGGVVTPNDNGKLLEIGKKYTLKGESTSAWFFSDWVATGSQTFASNGATLNFTMESNLVLQANFIPNPFASVAGTYIGLFQPYATNTLQNSGYIKLSINTKGAFSGYWETGTTRHSISGQLDADFEYTNSYDISGEGMVTIGFVVEDNSTISGSISGETWNSPLQAVQLATGVIAIEGAGVYSIDFTSDDESDDPTYSSEAAMNFTKKGPVTLTGKLPDGTKFSVSSVFSPSAPDANGPFYTSLYGGKGYLLGWMDYGPGDGGTDYADFEAEGDFVWLQRGGVAVPLYANGTMVKAAAIRQDSQ